MMESEAAGSKVRGLTPRVRRRSLLLDFLGMTGRPFLQSQHYYPHHFVPGCGLAGPYLELACRLVDEHLDTRDYFRAASCAIFMSLVSAGS